MRRPPRACEDGGHGEVHGTRWARRGMATGRGAGGGWRPAARACPGPSCIPLGVSGGLGAPAGSRQRCHRALPERRVPKAGTLRGAGRTHGTCPAVPAGCAGLHTPHCTPAACRVAQRFLPPATRPQRSTMQRWGQRGQRRLHPPPPAPAPRAAKLTQATKRGAKRGAAGGSRCVPRGVTPAGRLGAGALQSPGGRIWQRRRGASVG